MNRLSVSMGSCLLPLMLLVACAEVPKPQVTAADPVSHVSLQPQTRPVDAYLIEVNDELDIRFTDRPDLNQVVRVRPDGKVSFAPVGTIQAARRTPDAMTEDINQLLAQKAGALDSGTEAAVYLLQVGDELEVRFPYQSNLTQVTRVRPDGRISLPLVGSVMAKGRSPEALESQLRKDFAVYLHKPELTVVVRAYTSDRVFVGGKTMAPRLAQTEAIVMVRSFAYAPPQVYIGGEVMRPGVLAHRRPLTLLQALFEAGGNRPTAELRSVLVMRKAGTEQPLVIRRDIKKDLEGNATTADLYLEPFDVIYVPKTQVANVAEFLDQHVFSVVPFLRNSVFSFIYTINSSTGVQLK